MSEEMLKSFIEKLTLRLNEKTGWGRNQLLRIIKELHLKVLSETLERIENEKAQTELFNP